MCSVTHLWIHVFIFDSSHQVLFTFATTPYTLRLYASESSCALNLLNSIHFPLLDSYYSCAFIPAVLCPIHSIGTSVIAGCTCRSGYLGTVAASSLPPFYTSTCNVDPELALWLPFQGSEYNNGSMSFTISTNGFVTYSSGIVKEGFAPVQYAYFSNPNHLAMSVNYYLAVASSPFGAPLTLSVWIYLDTSAYTTALGYRSIAPITSGPYGIQLDINSNPQPLAAFALPNMWTAVYGTSVQAYSWFHVVLTISSSYEASMYVNGVIQQRATGTAQLAGYGELIIGGPGDNSRSFNGYLYDLRLYKRDISAAEALAIYNWQ